MGRFFIFIILPKKSLSSIEWGITDYILPEASFHIKIILTKSKVNYLQIS